jgi:hypothetical protein
VGVVMSTFNLLTTSGVLQSDTQSQYGIREIVRCCLVLLGIVGFGKSFNTACKNLLKIVRGVLSLRSLMLPQIKPSMVDATLEKRTVMGAIARHHRFWISLDIV